MNSILLFKELKRIRSLSLQLLYLIYDFNDDIFVIFFKNYIKRFSLNMVYIFHLLFVSQKHQKQINQRKFPKRLLIEKRILFLLKKLKTLELEMMFNQSVIYQDMWDGHVTFFFIDKRRFYYKELKYLQPFINLAKH